METQLLTHDTISLLDGKLFIYLTGEIQTYCFYCGLILWLFIKSYSMMHAILIIKHLIC